MLGTLSLVLGARSWEERRYLDAELLAGFVDAGATLGLAYALGRGSPAAAWLLLALAIAGALYATLWMGFPFLSILPQAVAGVLYLRAIAAVRLLRELGDEPG